QRANGERTARLPVEWSPKSSDDMVATMKFTALGRTGEQISAIGFGAMPLSIQGRPPEDVGRAVIAAVLDAGLTFIDTADVYCFNDGDLGHNERLIASAIRVRDVRVATKAGLRRPGGDWTRDGP